LKRSVSAAGIAVALLFGLLVCLSTAVAAKHSQLPSRYEHWLDEEVNYLITSQERTIFLGLTTDKDRDHFIETFWAIRNPDPTSPGNTFKDEHYRRLEYVNTHYGLPSAQNGWRTDRGMVYITLGPPQQKRSELNTKYLLPIEIWFYQDPGSALAPYFSVLFFQPSPAEPDAFPLS
jgi:GWxTD domain-containing protein